MKKISAVSKEAVLDTYEPKHVGKRKTTRRWCKGKTGVEHVPEIRFDPKKAAYSDPECHEMPFYVGNTNPENRRVSWLCYHVEVCVNCEKVMNHQPECPEKPGHLTNKE